MKIKTTNPGNAKTALDRVNRIFNGNITLKKNEVIKTMRDGRFLLDVQLAVESSRGEGASYSPVSGRRISAACWHVWGEFIDELGRIDQRAEVSVAMVADTRGFFLASAYEWVDSRRGNSYVSEWCHC